MVCEEQDLQIAGLALALFQGDMESNGSTSPSPRPRETTRQAPLCGGARDQWPARLLPAHPLAAGPVLACAGKRYWGWGGPASRALHQMRVPLETIWAPYGGVGV